MKERRGGRMTTDGPGTAAQALGIHVRHSGSDLIAGPIRIEDHGHHVPDADIKVGPRIGVDYAGMTRHSPTAFGWGARMRFFRGDGKAHRLHGHTGFAVASLDALHAAGIPIAAVVTAPDRPAGRGASSGCRT